MSSVEDGPAVVEYACPGASFMKGVDLCAWFVASGAAKLLTQHKPWGAWMVKLRNVCGKYMDGSCCVMREDAAREAAMSRLVQVTV